MHAQQHRESVLPPGVKARVTVEQASAFGWERYVGESGRIIGMKTFGTSATLKELLRLPAGQGRGRRQGVAYPSL